MALRVFSWLIILQALMPSVVGIAPLTGAYAVGAGIASMGIASYNMIYCRFKECCDDRWIVNNLTELNSQLDKLLHGQHLVKHVVLSHIKAHILSPQPTKALAFSFHGPTGTGKNYVSSIIADALYKKGLKSDSVLFIHSTQEFPHLQMVSLYKDHLRDLIEKQVKKCPQSMFIFDEIDKMPKGLMDTIKPYLDYHESLGGVDYRHAIFIFLSNAGGQAITNFALEHWKEGGKREDIKLVDMEKTLAKAAINSATEGGLYHSELVSKHLITAFIPFLPLERTSVKECIKNALVADKLYTTIANVPKELVEEILQELTFYPEKEQLFSVTGCKRVADKARLVVHSK